MQNNSLNCDAKDATEAIPLTRCLDIVAQIATFLLRIWPPILSTRRVKSLQGIKILIFSQIYVG